jgi:hypothetical protein
MGKTAAEFMAQVAQAGVKSIYDILPRHLCHKES